MLCQSHFWAYQLAKAIGISCQQLSAKIDAVFGHSTISVDAEPFHDIHMGPMSDVVMWNRLLVANLCQASHIFGLQLAKAYGKLSANFSQN